MADANLSVKVLHTRYDLPEPVPGLRFRHPRGLVHIRVGQLRFLQQLEHVATVAVPHDDVQIPPIKQHVVTAQNIRVHITN